MKKISDRCYCLLFLLMLITPFVFTNFKHDQTSEIDNSYLPEIEWEENTPVGKKIDDLENYLNMRIGFRNQFLDMYQALNDRLFGVMEHPLYMYGKDGYVYFKQWAYIVDYQHLNLNPDYADEIAHGLQVFSDLAAEHGADFYYLLIPDKKTVYPEYMPDGLNRFGDVSLTDQILQSLSGTDVKWLFLRDALLEAKQQHQVFDVKYDAGHWNDTGAFYGIRELYRRMRADYPEIPMLTEDEFDFGTEHVDSLLVSHFAIDEEVPRLTLKTSTAVVDEDWLKGDLSFPDPTSFRKRYVNPEKTGLPKLLIFHDSYIAGRERFFTENFSEVTFIHRYNLISPEKLAEYLDALAPDIVVYENPEAVFGTIRFNWPETGQ